MPEIRIRDFSEAACLCADPFASDFGAPGDRTLRKEMVTARKRHECCLCLGNVLAGERCRVQIEYFDGAMQQYRWCVICCVAMAKSFDDSGRMWESRERLRRRRAHA